jgi:hypothetical protein
MERISFPVVAAADDDVDVAAAFAVNAAAAGLLYKPESPRPELSPLVSCAGPAERRPAPMDMERISSPVVVVVVVAAADAAAGAALMSRPESSRPELSPLVSCAGPAECRPAPVDMERISFPVVAADVDIAAGFAVNAAADAAPGSDVDDDIPEDEQDVSTKILLNVSLLLSLHSSV